MVISQSPFITFNLVIILLFSIVGIYIPRAKEVAAICNLPAAPRQLFPGEFLFGKAAKSALLYIMQIYEQTIRQMNKYYFQCFYFQEVFSML